MNHKAYQPKMPDRMEAVFDAAYLIFDLIAGILFFTMAQGRSLFILYGVLTLTLPKRPELVPDNRSIVIE